VVKSSFYLYNRAHMITQKIFRGKTWIDAENPTSDEVKKLMDEFSLDTDVADELLNPSLKPRIERFSDYLYIILHFPAFKQSHSLSSSQEIDFIISEKFFITVRYDINETIERFSKNIEVENITQKAEIEFPTLFLFFKLIDELYLSSYNEIDTFDERLHIIEKNIFKGREKEMVFEISKFSRDILAYKQIVSPHKEVLKQLAKDWKLVFGDKGKHHIERLVATYFRLKNTHRGLLDTMQELRQTNDSLLSTKQNETMKLFTILAFVTFPLSLMAGLFGMNTAFTPFVGMPFDFWVIIGIMVTLTLIMFLFIKINKWL